MNYCKSGKETAKEGWGGQWHMPMAWLLVVLIDKLAKVVGESRKKEALLLMFPFSSLLSLALSLSFRQ